ncbi:DUF2470 domain-containing protein [Nocardia stercoris]|uniref:DUF2470 domain-containing protein n=2 Tax=Nocardia stercoris TaxID=2483361 RepID=A0A3M2LG92_9NOCA|nr:DUF2470 domain-containing protein [Nocardia stercoris]
MLAVPGSDPAPAAVHVLRRAGDVVVAVENSAPALVTVMRAGTGGVAAMLELTDHAPLPLREPVRSLVWLRGRAQLVPAAVQHTLAAQLAGEHPHPNLLDVGHTTTLLRMPLDSAVVADARGAEAVDHTALAAAAPDPFWEFESAWLRHLAGDHADIVQRLGRHLPVRLRGGAVHPLAIDRYGLTLRIEAAGGDHDVRLPFPAPVSDIEGLSRAVRLLAGCPFGAGLRHR